MSQQTIEHAIWVPAWYELDQTLELGSRQKYWFFQTPPVEQLIQSDLEADRIFFNQADCSQNLEVRYAKIIEMSHPQLGEMLKVDTHGLDYIFFPKESEEVVVNAEEEPGMTHDWPTEITDWSLLLTLTEVSEPMES